MVDETHHSVALDQPGRIGQVVAVGVGGRQLQNEFVLGVRDRAAADRFELGCGVGHHHRERGVGRSDSITGRDRHAKRSGKTVDRVDQQPIAAERNVGVIVADSQEHGRVGYAIAVGVVGRQIEGDRVLGVRHDLLANRRKHRSLVGDRHLEGFTDIDDPVVHTDRDPEGADKTVRRIDGKHISDDVDRRIALAVAKDLGRVGQPVGVGVGGREPDGQRILSVRHDPVADRLQHRNRIGHGDPERLGHIVNPVAHTNRDDHVPDEARGRIDRKHVVDKTQRRLAVNQSGRVGQRVGIGVGRRESHG